MTIDETGTIVNEQPQEKTTAVVIPMENEAMIREWGTKLINALVEASDLAKRVQALQVELSKITDALTVANENAARAIAERDEAFRARDRANELREQADHAYQAVNEQRINLTRELQDAKESLKVSEADRNWLTAQVNDLKIEIDLYKEGNDRLQKDVFNATSSAASMVDAVKAERDAIISALRLEVQALKDSNREIEGKFLVSEDDVRQLRKIIQEAKLAAAGVQGVLEGTLAAE